VRNADSRHANHTVCREGVEFRVKGVMSLLQESLAGEGLVWGGGQVCRRFADGADGYLADLLSNPARLRAAGM
jgi:hypothetical protein